MTSCSKCAAELASPLLCEACGELHSAPEANPFEVMGLSPAFEVDEGALRKRLLGLSRRMHPDYFGGADAATRELAERNTAAVNAAHEVLANDFKRADWLVGFLGGPAESEERQMPQEFLMEVLEWNETIEEARDSEPGSDERKALDELSATLSAERETQLSEIAEALTPLPARDDQEALAKTRRRLNAVRYVDRSLREITELRLTQASAR